ncbi:MAG TPA: phosphoribosylaminoimidazolesuccinocarboxamide synthase [Vicinamibacterales bacterium]|nr:phosphoribosylaminoimidazolesuccinocarboxamide synthase [Vicinamibacterales bacterium]
MTPSVVLDTTLPGLTLARRGKVRDVYDLGDRLLIVATDRVSAFDYVLGSGIPDKGRVLTQLSAFWFEQIADLVPHHLITTDVDQFPAELHPHRALLAGRSMLVRKTTPLPVECVARGYLSGSGWKDYQAAGAVCGIPLPAGLRESDRLPRTLFTPATKAESGHDENISEDEAGRLVGPELIGRLRDLTLALYERGVAHAATCGIIIADTKFEFGRLRGFAASADQGRTGFAASADQGRTASGASADLSRRSPEGAKADDLILIDEILTPDSSRFWPADVYAPGRSQASFDKQFVRDYLEQIGWNKQPPVPELPPDVVARTRAKYIEAYRRLTGREWQD